MYDSAANTTSNKVNTSIVFMGITLFLKTRGRFEIASAFFLVQLYFLSITQSDTSDNNGSIVQLKDFCLVDFVFDKRIFAVVLFVLQADAVAELIGV